MCHWCFYIDHETVALQKLLRGAKQEDLDAVEGALAQGANVDVGACLHGSTRRAFLVKDGHWLVIVELLSENICVNAGTKFNGRNSFKNSFSWW